MRNKILLVLLLQANAWDTPLRGAKAQAEKHVAFLNSSNFAAWTKRTPCSLIEFYAPWCPHCQHTAPIFSQAAKVCDTVGIVVALVTFVTLVTDI